MAKILVTGSSDGIGLAAAKLLSEQGNQVWLHARNAQRGDDARSGCPKAAGVLIGDLTSKQGITDFAAEAKKNGPWESVIHNAGIGASKQGKTAEGLGTIFTVNSLAPYMLTCLMDKPKKLLYLSSGAHYSGSSDLSNFEHVTKESGYSDSKLHDIWIANAVARRWKGVQSCSMDPGWIKTNMGGSNATGHVSTPAKAIADFVDGKLSIGDRTGVYLNQSKEEEPLAAASDEKKQDQLFALLEKVSGLKLE